MERNGTLKLRAVTGRSLPPEVAFIFFTAWTQIAKNKWSLQEAIKAHAGVDQLPCEIRFGFTLEQGMSG